MPRISEFFGIYIYMYFGDHTPPHFHAYYGEYDALISIEDLRIIRGKLPPRAYGLVVEWAMEHKAELMENWSKAIASEPLSNIKPLR